MLEESIKKVDVLLIRAGKSAAETRKNVETMLPVSPAWTAVAAVSESQFADHNALRASGA